MEQMIAFGNRIICMLAVTVTGLILLMAVPVHAAQTQHAIVTVKDSSGVSGSYSWIQEQKSGGSRLNEHNMMPTIADIRAAAHNQYYYIMEGGGLNRITCFDIRSLDNAVWQYSAKEPGETGDTLPWDLISISERKAYLLRYGSSIAWIVDPLAENEAGFKTGELDLSAYDDNDGSPEMCCGVVANGKAFIALKRLGADGSAQTGYLAVIDTATDSPVDTVRDSGGLPGIPLSVKNPVSIAYLAETGSIYVHGCGSLSPQVDYTGGIEKINPDLYASEIILDDGDTDSHPYGYITGMALISSRDVFFIGAASEKDEILYHFNPMTGVVDEVAFNASDPNFLKHIRFAGLTGGIGADQHSRLWLANITDHQVEILLTTPNNGLYSRDGSFPIPNDNTGSIMNPTQIVFCKEPEITAADEAEKPSSSGDSGNFCFIGTLRH
ncbi:MAG: hypothetical protein ABIK15_09215 [Pseudomonadota bacterium]